MNSSLTMLWGMVNAQQLISHLPLHNQNIPAQALILYEYIMVCAEFDYIPMDSLHDKYIDYGGQDHAVSDVFGQLGY